MYKNIFLNNESNDSKEKVLKYFMKLDNDIKKYIVNDNPYMGGNFEKNVKKFLEGKSINTNIGDVDSLFEVMAEYFRGTTRWHHPYVMNNIKTPVNLLSLVVGYHCMLLDPNLAGDTNCGQIAFAELEVIKYLSDLIEWNWEKSGGYFTFGGTSTLLNAVKIGINKVEEKSCLNGINDDIFIISSEQGHSAHADVCNWLGIGKKKCIRVPVDENYQFDVNKAEKIIDDMILSGKKLATIIACGGTTIEMLVDNIKDIYDMRNRVVKKHKLNYKPHIHVDSVVGWVWLFYKGYSFEKNKLSLSKTILHKIEKMFNLIAECKYADSIGIDFHKTGFCPYASSLFLNRNRDELFKLNDKNVISIEKMEYGMYNPSTYTLELSRSSIGPMTALTAITYFGKDGFRIMLRDIIEGANILMVKLNSKLDFEVINNETLGTCILFIVKPKDCYLKYNDLAKSDFELVKKLAVYNYKFYLYILNKLNNQDINFFIDYSSGYEKIKNGFHMGILKMQTFNPMLNENKAEKLIEKIIKVKKDFDNELDKEFINTIYKPKKFKFTYNNINITEGF